MALKDWKKETKKKKFIHFSNRKNESLYIWKTHYSYESLRGRWHVDASRMKSQKNFKTKSQALKFAKSYMRKH